MLLIITLLTNALVHEHMNYDVKQLFPKNYYFNNILFVINIHKIIIMNTSA